MSILPLLPNHGNNFATSIVKPFPAFQMLIAGISTQRIVSSIISSKKPMDCLSCPSNPKLVMFLEMNTNVVQLKMFEPYLHQKIYNSRA